MFLFGILLFPCFMEKPAFPFTYADRMYVMLKNWFLLSGRAVFYCRCISLQEKLLVTFRKNSSQILTTEAVTGGIW